MRIEYPWSEYGGEEIRLEVNHLVFKNFLFTIALSSAAYAQTGVTFSIGSGGGWNNNGVQWGVNVQNGYPCYNNYPVYQNNYPVYTSPGYSVPVYNVPVAYPNYNYNNYNYKQNYNCNRPAYPVYNAYPAYRGRGCR